MHCRPTIVHERADKLCKLKTLQPAICRHKHDLLLVAPRMQRCFQAAICVHSVARQS